MKRLALLVLIGLAWGCGDDDSGAPDSGAPDSGAPDSGGRADAAPDGALSPDGAAGPDAAAPWVTILEPADQAVVENPVTFRVAAGGGVAQVELFVDDWSLAAPWDPAVSDALEHSFSGLGYERHVVLKGYDAAQQEVAFDAIDLTVVSSDIGTYLGVMWNTYYYVAREADYSGPDDTTLYDSQCNPIADVPAEYSDDVCIEGSGILEDGRVINYASTCGCGRSCPTGGIVCYAVLDPAEFPWGMGSVGNPLEPLRSWAVDNSIISAGTLLYAEQWDGVAIPSIDGLGGFVHDGCFRADDVGGWINGMHYDFFAGTHGMWQALEAIHATHSDFDVYVDPGKCAYLQP